MSLLDARDLLTYLQRTTRAQQGAIDGTQQAKLDSVRRLVGSGD